GSAGSRAASSTVVRAARVASRPAAEPISRGPARSGWTAHSRYSPCFARLQITLLSRRRVRIGLVVVAREDAHVVLRRESEDEIRRHAVPGVRAPRVAGVCRRALVRIRSFDAAQLGGGPRG